MNARKTIAISEMKVELWNAAGGLCLVCGKPLRIENAELAHRIPQRRWCFAKWGPAVIHHARNLVLTHRGACNDAVSLGNHPVAMERLAAEIEAELRKEKE